MILLVLISFTFFDASSMGEAFNVIGGMFGSGASVSQSAVYYLKSYSLILVMAIIGATPIPKMIVTKLRAKGEVAAKTMDILEIVYAGILFLLVVCYLIDGSFNPFLYFRF